MLIRTANNSGETAAIWLFPSAAGIVRSQDCCGKKRYRWLINFFQNSKNGQATLSVVWLSWRPSASEPGHLMLVQIYEVQTPEEAVALARLGVDHVGVLVGDGVFPRELPWNRRRRFSQQHLPVPNG